MQAQLASLVLLAQEEQSFWDTVFSQTDATIYFFMAVFGTALFLIRLVLMLAVGAAADMDFDVDADADLDGGIDVHDAGFSIISLLSILSFMMAAGWMGYLCRTSWGFGPLGAAASASGFGFAMMLLASSGMYGLKRLQQAGHYDAKTSIGTTGRVYLKIPANGEGTGQVEVTVGGRRSVHPAIYRGDKELESFTSIKVAEVRDDQVLVVEPIE